MQRRHFLTGSTAALALASTRRLPAAPTGPASQPLFTTQNAPFQQVYDAALQVLAANVVTLPHFDGPVLIEGAEYPGIWQECAPQEGLVYSLFNPQAARNNHLTFFALQRPDGQLPANNKRSETGFGQIQMVVPIAATAWELAHATNDDELLHKAYDACSRWDAWLLQFRNTRGTGLTEGFCTYDTGHDNSPRWRGVANQCPGKDAKRFVAGQGTPRLCPDLSATTYGARIALAAMARALGKPADESRWLESAATIRNLILTKLYDPEDLAFYDLDASNYFVKVRGDVLSRVCGEHVPDQKLFDTLWTGQLHKPSAFWPPYPLPSISLDDPSFVRPIPRNSWGGASQALTALRAPRWMEHYGHPADLAHMMLAWSEALQRDGTFRQQMDPETGIFTDGGSKGYSPAALVLLDFTWRLAGIRELTQQPGQGIEWNIRPGISITGQARFTLTLRSGKSAELAYTPTGATLSLGGKPIAQLEGTGRLVTDANGHPLHMTGISATPATLTLKRPDHSTLTRKLAPNLQAAVA